ncbi:hypothetical protein BKA82DRAFT_4127077 [Pisolithus tinctorius]|nr:hypothetical protein BKA82DRAFT_4127077 [Pisolithus tinctorius]
MDRDDEAENVQTAMRPQLQQRSSFSSFVLIIFMLFLLTNHSGDEFLARNHHYDALPLLLTNFAPWTSHAESYMANMNMTEIVNYLGTQDWKATRKMAWSVVNRAVVEEGVSDKLAMAHGRIDFVDATSGNEMRLDFEGVYFIANGSVYGFAEPPGRHIDIRYLPAIVPEDSQNETTRVVRKELQSRIDKIKTMIDNGVIDQESLEANSGVQSDCGFLVYAQIEPSPISEELMIDVESELQSPTRKWTPNVFPLRVNGVLLSRECGVLYRFHHAEGLRTQSFLRRVVNYGSISGVISLITLTLSCHHVDRTHSPAALQRLSVWTFSTQAIVDAYHATLINQVQAPGDALNTTISPPRPPQQAPQDNGPGAETAQPAQRPQTPPPLTARSFLSAFARNLYSYPQARIWIGLLICLTFVVRAIVSPSLALFFVGSMYSLFWLPQIIRSIRCGRSSSLSAEYLIGMSICRLWFPFYFLANSTNVLDVEPRRECYPERRAWSSRLYRRRWSGHT